MKGRIPIVVLRGNISTVVEEYFQYFCALRGNSFKEGRPGCSRPAPAGQRLGPGATPQGACALARLPNAGGVRPLLLTASVVFASTSAPPFSSAVAAATCPLNAATCKGISPLSLRMFGSAPNSSSSVITPTSPDPPATRKSGVCPSQSEKLGSAPPPDQ